ncbi:MAG: hypothetical protein S4CHLAM7_09110 [Chlamydiae bacterium]|nr:hypothetical protein [Chlamydiota bacterium]
MNPDIENWRTLLPIFKNEPIFPTTPEDEEEFYNYLSLIKTPALAFENNWPYIIQATRNRGYKYEKGNSIVYFHFKNLNFSSPVVIVNHLGPKSIDLCLKLTELFNTIEIDVLIKNVDTNDLEQWKELGFAETTSPWNSCTLRDDNSFPDYIYDFERIANAHLPRKSNDGSIPPIKQKKGRMLRKFNREREIIVKPYKPNLREEIEIRKALEKSARYLEDKGTDLYQNVIDAHLFIFDQKIKKNIFQYVHYENGILKAYSYLTYIQDSLFYNAIINHKEPSLMLFILWQGVNYIYNTLHHPKPKYLSLQGSEIFGQNHWKKQLNPVITINKTHIIKKASLKIGKD